MWLGIYAEYILDAHGAEKRIRKQVVLCPVKNGEQVIGKREAQKLLQPYVDRMNCSMGGQPEWERNLEAAQLAGAAIERAVAKRQEELNAEKAESFVRLNAVNENGLGGAIS
jgi:hypothetical protein